LDAFENAQVEGIKEADLSGHLNNGNKQDKKSEDDGKDDEKEKMDKNSDDTGQDIDVRDYPIH
jgi:carboxyl-terminal processing protease